MSLLDSLGESLGGLTDSVLSGGEKFVDSWFDNEANKVASAAPEENRPATHQEPAQQPTGQPIHYGMPSTNTLLMVGGGVVVMMMFFMLMMRGK
ncbi:hypothetical protein MD588_18970 [Photobacterium sp. SDRW27]|uniref:hypothetical protein n=1 Tax=Photobacterium obscurum TaxID=2829490 RepID=UPI002243293B|nr:hypothetical protein [Photobacterium obscurum]MCW8330879.1 hypothetical protein [Photobacterium obscurum]